MFVRSLRINYCKVPSIILRFKVLYLNAQEKFTDKVFAHNVRPHAMMALLIFLIHIVLKQFPNFIQVCLKSGYKNT